MMPIKKALGRRSFLRGAGAMISLPLLDAICPALTPLRLTAASAAMRLGFVYTPNGLSKNGFPQKPAAAMSCQMPCGPWNRFASRCCC